MSASPNRFFAPRFFSPSYFPSLAAAGGVAPDPVYGDRDAYAALVASLVATGEFADVFFGTTSDQRPGGADSMPAAVVTPDGWAEADDVDPVVLVRQVSFTLTVVARAEDPLGRYETLDRLSCVAQNAIDGSDLGGTCLPALTKLRQGRFDPRSNQPEQSLILQGEFTYLVPSLADHRTRY